MRFLLLFLIIFLGCAIPKDNDAVESRVSEEELRVVLLVRSGLEYYLKSRYIDAEFAFRKALVLYPESANIKANLAAALLAQGQAQESLEIYESLNLADPENLDYILGIAECYVLKEDYPAALAKLEQIEQAYLNKADYAKAASIESRLAGIKFDLGAVREAACHYKRSFELLQDIEVKARFYRLAIGLDLVKESDLLIPGRELKMLDVQELFALMLIKYQEADYSKVIEISEILENRKLKQSIEFEVDFIETLARLNSGETNLTINFLSEAQLESLPPKVSLDIEDLSKKGLLQIPENFQWQVPS